jgi:CRISPR-associated protein Cas2
MVVKDFQCIMRLIILKVMYVILVYDIEEKRVAKMLKLCRRYLNWIQNSVFEGELTQVKLKELLQEAKQIMNEEKDSCIIFKSREEKWLEKQVIGKEKNELDNIL